MRQTIRLRKHAGWIIHEYSLPATDDWIARFVNDRSPEIHFHYLMRVKGDGHVVVMTHPK